MFHDASGRSVLQAGNIPESEQQIKTLIDSTVSRSLDDKSAKAGKGELNSAQREAGVLSLDQIKLSIGDSIQLQFQSDLEQSRCVVTLIGYLKGQSVIVTTPIINGTMMLVREGQDFVIRLFSGKSAYAFTTMAKRVTNTPYPTSIWPIPRKCVGWSYVAAPVDGSILFVTPRSKVAGGMLACTRHQYWRCADSRW